MTPETKKTFIWTGGALVAIIAVLVILWAAGGLEPPPATEP